MSENGICKIKAEFIIEDHHTRELELERVSEKDKRKFNLEDEEDSQPNEKKPRLSKAEKKKLRGQNKSRGPTFRCERDKEICVSLINVLEGETPKECTRKNCLFMHDPIEYLKIKPKDLGKVCYNFQISGRCFRGLSCRYGDDHITSDGKNRINLETVKEYEANAPHTVNQIGYEMQIALRKRSYDFSLAEKLVRYNDELRKELKIKNDNSNQIKVTKIDESNDIKIDKLNELQIELKNNSELIEMKIDDSDVVINKEGKIVADLFNNEVKIDEIKDLNLEINNEAKVGTDLFNNELKIELKNNSELIEMKIDDSDLEINKEAKVVSDMFNNEVKIDAIKDLGLEINKEAKVVADLFNNELKIDAIEIKIEDSNKTNIKIKKDDVNVSSGAIIDEDIIKLLQREKKTIDFKNKLFLSPLTTVGNLPFRRICKEYGADITCGEMAMCTSLLQGAPQEWALVKRHHTEKVFGVQLCANNPYLLTKCGLMLEQETDIDFIDLNLGCPIELVYKEGGGCGLLRRSRVLELCVRNLSQILTIPMTIKTRMGVYTNDNIAHNLVPKFRDWGASLVTIHGRSREQRYHRSADWSYINQCVKAAKPMPLYGNGDILSYEDYQKSLEICPDLSGVMIGRGALIKPWIFTEIKERKVWDISSSERFDILKKYTNYGLEHWGSDNKGVENTRRFMLEWLSFLNRYIPVGLLENPPQKINERPPSFRGRDDLETLMISNSASDWVKISEMLLGPVPDNFHFLPKHKANSYK